MLRRINSRYAQGSAERSTGHVVVEETESTHSRQMGEEDVYREEHERQGEIGRARRGAHMGRPRSALKHPFGLIVFSGIGWITSQCSTIFPFSSQRAGFGLRQSHVRRNRLSTQTLPSCLRCVYPGVQQRPANIAEPLV